jgi:hypothetical protein
MRRLIAMSAIALALMLPGPVAATTPQSVAFDSHWYWGTEKHDGFSGAPLPGCASGDTYTTAFFRGHMTEPISQGRWRKLFVCEGSGATFTLQLEGRIVWEPSIQTSFRWVVLDATGNLAGMHGTGTGYAYDIDELGGIDRFEGWVHFDP